LAAFDPSGVAMHTRAETDYIEIAVKDLTLDGAEASHLPLAQVGAARPLPLSGGVNPAYAAALSKLSEQVVTPLLGARAELSEADWQQIRDRLQAHVTWLQGKKGAVVEKLSAERIVTLHALSYKTTLLDLIAKDKELESEAQSLQDVERLVRYYRDLYTLCTNFVNFKDFYAPERDRKSTRLNSSHVKISYAVFCYVTSRDLHSFPTRRSSDLERIVTLHALSYKTTLLDLIAKDKELESEAQSLQDVERLVRYYRDLYTLCTNFVNFKDFYAPE